MNTRTRDEILALPVSESFSALTAVVERLTGRCVDARRDPASLDVYEASARHVHIPHNDVEGLLHELCHWVVAGPRRRCLENYGLDPNGPGWRGSVQEEVCCGWIEEDAYARAGVEMPQSSVHTERYWDSPWWRPVALSRWCRHTSWADRIAVVGALRLPGGGVGLWSQDVYDQKRRPSTRQETR